MKEAILQAQKALGYLHNLLYSATARVELSSRSLTPRLSVHSVGSPKVADIHRLGVPFAGVVSTDCQRTSSLIEKEVVVSPKDTVSG
jgi:hypothetical protein